MTTQLGMIELLGQAGKPYIFKVVLDNVGSLHLVIFCRKIHGIPGWYPTKTHYLREESPSLARARRAALKTQYHELPLQEDELLQLQ